LRKLPIGFRQIPDKHDRDQIAYLEGAGTGGGCWLETRWMISACHVPVDAACDSLPGLLLPVLLD
jgi:hypothetical protein